VIPEDAAAAFVGLDPADLDELELRLENLDGLPAIGRALRSAVETAAADLAARSAGLPLAASLAGRCRPSVALNGLIGIVDAATATALAVRLATEGYRCLKLKVGDEGPEALAERVGAIRGAVGPGVFLRIDANGAWPDAATRGRFPPRAPPVRTRVRRAAAAGRDGTARDGEAARRDERSARADESVTGLDAARALLEAGAADVLVVKPARVGGVRQSLRIATLAAAAGVPVVVSTLLETGVGLSRRAARRVRPCPRWPDGERRARARDGRVARVRSPGGTRYRSPRGACRCRPAQARGVARCRRGFARYPRHCRRRTCARPAPHPRRAVHREPPRSRLARGGVAERPDVEAVVDARFRWTYADLEAVSRGTRRGVACPPGSRSVHGSPPCWPTMRRPLRCSMHCDASARCRFR